MSPNAKRDNDTLYLDLFLRESSAVTDKQIAYFREHPGQIDEVTAPIHIHRFFLWAGALLGVLLVGVSKLMKFTTSLVMLGEGLKEFIVDIVYEAGVALIGAVVTAYILGVLLKKYQGNAARWRAEIRRRLGESSSSDEAATSK